jgi:hypothetical protein
MSVRKNVRIEVILEASIELPKVYLLIKIFIGNNTSSVVLADIILDISAKADFKSKELNI